MVALAEEDVVGLLEPHIRDLPAVLPGACALAEALGWGSVLVSPPVTKGAGPAERGMAALVQQLQDE
eukprot:3389404-Alexandrium_andersonii.AAC.1